MDRPKLIKTDQSTTTWRQKQYAYDLYCAMISKTALDNALCTYVQATYMRLCMRVMITAQDSFFENWHPSWHTGAVEFAALADVLTVALEASYQP